MIQLFYPDGSIINQTPSSETPLSDRLNTSFKAIDAVLDALIKNGFIASGERSVVSADQIEDWVDGIAPCTLTIAIDGDATLQGKRRIRRMTSTLPHATSPFICTHFELGQILLQEQGYRLYPNFAKFLINAVLKKIFQYSSQSVSIEEYYMDTNYSSDPDLFDAKQVLLNVVIDNS
jgi:hypothetical protein